MKIDRASSVPRWLTGPALLIALLAFHPGCGRSGGGEETPAPQPYIEPYTGPCPAGQSNWDCMSWNQDNWE